MPSRTGSSATVVGTILLVFFLPLMLVACFHANPGVMLAGAVTWALALPVKGPAYRLAARLLRKRLRTAEWAAVCGVLSAVSELALSGAYLIWFLPSSSVPNLIGFGVGASSAEILFLLTTSVVRRIPHRGRSHPDTRAAEVHRSFCIRYQFLVERFATLLLHVGSRCLVYMSLSQHEPWAGLWAMVSFSVVDGVAAYGKLCRWNWFDPHICRTFYGIVLAAGASDLALFAVKAGPLR